MVITVPILYPVRAPIYQLIPIKRSLMEKNISTEGGRVQTHPPSFMEQC